MLKMKVENIKSFVEKVGFLVFFLFVPSVYANWLTIGVLDEKGKPSHCIVMEENQSARTQIVYDAKMNLIRVDFLSKIIDSKTKRKIPFKAIKVGDTYQLYFDKVTEKTPKEIIGQFRRKNQATLLTQYDGVKAKINLVGFSRALRNCKLMMK